MKTEFIPNQRDAEIPSKGRGINGKGMFSISLTSIPLPLIPLPPRSPRRCVLFSFAALLLCGFALIPFAGHAATTNLTVLLQQGLFEEQANRNFDAAIENYSALARQFDKDRQLAATAVFRLGECYRALGKTNEAAAQYQRILRDFSDQQTLATLSGQDLAGIGVVAQRILQSVSENTLSGLETRYQLMKLQLDQARSAADPYALARILDDEGLKKLNEERGEIARQGSGTNQFSKEFKEKMQAHLDRINGYQKSLFAEREHDLATLETAIQQARASQSVQVSTTGPPATATTDEEDKEIARIQNMIQNSPDLINAPGEGGNTPLNKAAYNGWLKVAAFLLDHGADVNAGGIPPLNSAATAGNRAMAELLLSRGANVNSKGSLGKTPLHTAVEKKFAAVAEVLLANKADVNASDDFGNTPLVFATENKQVKLIQALLAAGGNPNLENEDGRIPFSFAAASGSPELVKMFLAAKADPNGGRLDTPLLVAIHAKDVVSAELLLQAGANPKAKGEDDWQPNTLGAFGRPVGRGSESPIHLAVVSGQLPMVELLLKFKADPNDSRTDDQPVLFKALTDTNVLAALLEHGANPNVASGDNRYSPLMSAAAAGNAESVSLLLKRKADPNAADSTGNTALWNAVQKQSPATVRALLAGGANPDYQTINGYPALVLAVADTGNKEVLAALIEAKANVNAPDPEGKTALHWAAERNRKDLVELLVKAGADVNLRTRNGATPLDFAKSSDSSAGRGPGIPIPQPGRSQALSYQWHNSADQTAPTKATSTADLLRQNGALDKLPDFTRIRITRLGLSQPVEVFHRAATLTNQFTLLETLMRFYSFSQVYIPGQGNREAWTGLPFPDFRRIIIRRPSQKIGGNEQEIKVCLLNSSNVVDCAQDVPVQFGDVIEIPEFVHALNAGPPNPVQEMENDFHNVATATPPQTVVLASGSSGSINVLANNLSLNDAEKKSAALTCLQKSVQLVVAGETKTFKVNSWKEGFLSLALGKTEARSALRSSSDLSRVQVTRKTGNSTKPAVFIVEVSDSAPRNEDLWLQDGDVIEVPEKR